MKRLALAVLLLAGWTHEVLADAHPPGGNAEAAWSFSYMLEDKDTSDGVAAAMTSVWYQFDSVAYGGNPFYGYGRAVSEGFRLTEGHAALDIDWDDAMYGPHDFYRVQERLDFELTPNSRLTVTGVLNVAATAPTDDTFVPQGWYWPVRIRTTARAIADASLNGSFARIATDSTGLRKSAPILFVVETGAQSGGAFSLNAGMDVEGVIAVEWLDAQPVPEPASLSLLMLGLPLVLGLPASLRIVSALHLRGHLA